MRTDTERASLMARLKGTVPMNRGHCTIGTLMLTLLMAGAQAQSLVPIRYRLTRTTPGQNTVQHIIQASEMDCSLTQTSPMPAASLRIEAPSNTALDCQWVDTARVIITPNLGIPDTYTIAGQLVDGGPFGLESSVVVAVAPAPPRFRVKPPESVSFLGTVILEPYPLLGLQVAQTWLDVGGWFYFGAPLLSADGFTVAAGDRMRIAVSRPH